MKYGTRIRAQASAPEDPLILQRGESKDGQISIL